MCLTPKRKVPHFCAQNVVTNPNTQYHQIYTSTKTTTLTVTITPLRHQQQQTTTPTHSAQHQHTAQTLGKDTLSYVERQQKGNKTKRNSTSNAQNKSERMKERKKRRK